jgi:hypothetical protein
LLLWWLVCASFIATWLDWIYPSAVQHLILSTQKLTAEHSTIDEFRITPTPSLRASSGPTRFNSWLSGRSEDLQPDVFVLSKDRKANYPPAQRRSTFDPEDASATLHPDDGSSHL